MNSNGALKLICLDLRPDDDLKIRAKIYFSCCDSIFIHSGTPLDQRKMSQDFLYMYKFLFSSLANFKSFFRKLLRVFKLHIVYLYVFLYYVSSWELRLTFYGFVHSWIFCRNNERLWIHNFSSSMYRIILFLFLSDLCLGYLSVVSIFIQFACH